jgi:hypothetical protein
MRNEGQLLACSQTAWALTIVQRQAAQTACGKVRFCHIPAVRTEHRPDVHLQPAAQNVLSSIQVGNWNHNLKSSRTPNVPIPISTSDDIKVDKVGEDATRTTGVRE